MWLSNHLPNAGTFSKSPLAWGLPPDIHVKEARGNKVLLSDDSWLIDWTSALGANILGQGSQSWGQADYLARQIQSGLAYTLPHWLEAETAEKLATLLTRNVPSWASERVGVRFCGTGTDAVTMAVRLARAVTGREYIICIGNGYHGWADWSIARTEPAAGIPIGGSFYTSASWARCSFSEPFGIISELEIELEYLEDDTAALVFEHPPQDPPPNWWSQVRELCNQYGTLLIADEVVTGLRNAPGGACQQYGIEPDLVCMGKALGNGAPVAALTGRGDLMDRFAGSEPVFCSSTSWGNSFSLAAANYVLDLWLERGEELCARINTLGQKLMGGLRDAGWSVSGHGPRSVLEFDSPYHRKFFIEKMMERGHLFNRPNFVNLSTSEGDIKAAVRAAEDVYNTLRVIKGDLESMYSKDELPMVLFEGR